MYTISVKYTSSLEDILDFFQRDYIVGLAMQFHRDIVG